MDRTLPDDVITHFGLTSVNTKSLVHWSPVFRARWQSRDVVVKPTQSNPSYAQSIATWTQRRFETYRDSVVTLTDTYVSDDIRWTLYPWIEGTSYTGEPTELYLLGQLLGSHHATGQEDEFTTSTYEFEITDEEESKSIIDFLTQSPHLTHNAPSLAKLAENLLAEDNTTHTPALQEAKLPTVISPFDMKANNIIFQDGQPILIDPDRLTRVPRVVDLALAYFLFHNDAPAGPCRLFNQAEWSYFVAGYQSQLELEESEIRTFRSALIHVYCDEGYWLLRTDPEGWNDSRQKEFLRDLSSWVYRIPSQDNASLLLEPS